MRPLYKFLLSVLIFSLAGSSGFSQTATVSGYIYDNHTGEALIGANLRDAESNRGTQSNTYGFYSITLPGKKTVLEFSYVGYQIKRHELDFRGDTSLNIYLNPSVDLETVEVTASSQSDRIQESSQMSAINVPISQIKSVPLILGESDVLKALQLLPGVQSGGEGQSGLFVRGGSPDQNLILLDGVPVYNAFHLFGFFSVFNTDAIRDVNLIKGGFPARYGGRLSSVVDISLKEGNNREFGGTASIGLLASRVTLEGPIIKGRTSFIVSFRRTYLDLLVRPLIKESFRRDESRGGAGFYFYDLNAKVNHKLSDKDRLFFSIYSGDDKFYFRRRDLSDSQEISSIDTGLGWGNLTSALRWNRRWNPQLFSNTTLTFTRYRLFTRIGFKTEERQSDHYQEIALKYDAGIRDIGAKIDFDYLPSPEHHIRFGLNFVHHNFNTGLFELRDIVTAEDYSFTATVGQREIGAQEFYLYAEDEYKVNSQLKINAGLHFSGFLVEGKNYFSLQPRLSGRYLLPGTTSSLKFAFSTMQQNIHLLSNEGIGLPTDLWVPSTERILPQESWQLAAGYAREIGRRYELTLEAYYKEMSNVLSYGDGEGIYSIEDWQDRVTQGDGQSYGLELFAHKKEGRLNGWIGYTLSWTHRKFEDLNFGRKFPFRYDRRHDISIVANYELNPRVDISATWVYGTGNAITIPDSRYLGSDEEGRGQFYQYFGNRNDFRMSSYHRLDVGINFKREHRNFSRTISVGAYNAYANQNPFFVYLDSELRYNEETNSWRHEEFLRQVNLFPLLPYVTYTIEF
jgi:hypothetical protein